MTIKSIDLAEKEAKKFLEKVTALKAATKEGDCFFPPKESGALKRCSMDLTRALADMRKP